MTATAASAGLGGSAGAPIGINADNTSVPTVRTISILTGIAVALSNGTLPTDVNAVGARALAQRARLGSG